ncbi:MAG: hypothetical protein BJ554DRAFT_6518 [Olpidium bornovanus]|uniref:Uncharacterized protein n=1 Tax=Olpidium bornovanus TaxID=278681 RepID=A0A8H7ZXK2_9FUNG|nr:MAG: hypothetical protein BJ554DRAFT_6518 [Olpidium bornovanus]
MTHCALQNIDDATEADRAIQTKRRSEMKQMKKDVFAERQKADMNQLLARKEATSQNMQELLASLAGTLRHDEVLPMTHLACDIVWLETYMVSLHYHENTVYR